MKALKSILSSKYFQNPFKMFQFLSENDRATAFPNLFIALRIYIIIPVTIAFEERSFFRLKFIINYLRSTKTQDRLNCLAIMSIESQEARQLNYFTRFYRANTKIHVEHLYYRYRFLFNII